MPTVVENECGRSKADRKTRVELAAAVRHACLFGWDELTLAHMTARAPDDPEHLLLQSPTILFEEVTASNLQRLDADGRHVVPSADPPRTFPFHREIYSAFPEAQSIMHLHTRPITAVTMQQQGVLMGDQYALWLGPVGYHDYLGLTSTPEEGARAWQEPSAADRWSSNVATAPWSGDVTCPRRLSTPSCL